MLPCLRLIAASSKVAEKVISLPCSYRTTRWLRFETRTSEQASPQAFSEENSIFSSSASPWDQIFNEDEQPKVSHSLRDTSDEFRPLRRQTITERESKAITGMLDMIFNKRRPDGVELPEAKDHGVGGKSLDDLVSRVRRHSKPLRWAAEPTADLLDQKREEMLRCNSDQELLEWAQREVFDESTRYETAAKHSLEGTGAASGSPKELPMLQSPIYPKIVAHLMRTFRDHYRDPNLALFIFHHTQKLSVVSYVFGCSTESYNELIQTRWSCFRDLEGVHNAVQEMVVNGVTINGTTRKIIEGVRRDIGQVELQTEAGQESRQATWGLLSKVEQLVASKAKPSKPAEVWDRWKSDVLNEGVAGDEDFNEWVSDADSHRQLRSMNTRRALTRYS